MQFLLKTAVCWHVTLSCWVSGASRWRYYLLPKRLLRLKQRHILKCASERPSNLAQSLGSPWFFSLLVTTLRSGDSAVSIVIRLRNGCLLWAAVHWSNVCYRLRKADMARRQACSSVFTYSISKIQRTTSTLGFAVSSRIWDTFQGRMCAVRNLSPEMLHVYILHSLTFHSLVVSISTGSFNTETSELRTNSMISLYNINWLVFITETECVYCAVRTGSLYIIQVMCFVWIWEQTAIISLYSINWLVFTTET